MEVNALVSYNTELPYEYYSLPFCKPAGGVQRSTRSDNAGTTLSGLRAYNSPYEFEINVRACSCSASTDLHRARGSARCAHPGSVLSVCSGQEVSMLLSLYSSNMPSCFVLCAVCLALAARVVKVASRLHPRVFCISEFGHAYPEGLRPDGTLLCRLRSAGRLLVHLAPQAHSRASRSLCDSPSPRRAIASTCECALFIYVVIDAAALPRSRCYLSD